MFCPTETVTDPFADGQMPYKRPQKLLSQCSCQLFVDNHLCVHYKTNHFLQRSKSL